MSMDTSFLFGFLAGCLTTTLGGWHVQKFMNNRKNTKNIKNKKYWIWISFLMIILIL